MTITLSRRTIYILVLVAALGVGFGVGAIVFSGGGGETITTTEANPGDEDGSVQEGGSEGSEDESSEEVIEDDCKQKGISSEARLEGTCTEGGKKIVVVNKDGTLKLETLDVNLLGIRQNKTLSSDLGPETASGMFVTFEVSIKNKAKTPASFEEEQCVLYIDGNTYTQDFEVQNGTEQSSFLWQATEIQPQNVQTGTVTFDVPKSVLVKLDESGNLNFTNFGESAIESARELGTIRTYQ
jgi:hypothetical protein